MPFVRPECWLPVGVNSLEQNADLVVRSKSNTLVVAGPGAGKTELLAQRACYLLDTGICPPPQRILAISFKRDAAKNLGERVGKRCGDRATRFDSLTLDAFGKSLVDRFRQALPEDWQPDVGYEVATAPLKPEEMRVWLKTAGTPTGHTQMDFQCMEKEEIKIIFESMAFGQVLPYTNEGIPPLLRHFGLGWWGEQLSVPPGKPSLSFPMLNRLAAFLLRTNSRITSVLRATYPFVFLDEFQDTTEAQYDLIRASFLGSSAGLTAVGDSKQRIMLWAGAMANIFDAYQSDFNAKIQHLTSNYRSAPELVHMQHVIAQAVESGTPAAKAARTASSGSCVILEFSNPEAEAEYLATLIQDGLREDGKQPRDFCILVRQRTGEMIEALNAALASRGIPLRDESLLQDLLAEPVAEFVIAILCLATSPRNPEAWDTLVEKVSALRGLGQEDDSSLVERESRRLFAYAKEWLRGKRPITALPSELVAMVGEGSFRSVYRQYARGSYLRETLRSLSAALGKSSDTTASTREAVDDLIGFNVVPAMTIHKSKGLEFRTVIFLGLEDSPWWAFSKQPEEEKRGFFVAFSRASEQVYFTFADVRDERWGRKQQQRDQIDDLYMILRKAGVQVEDHRA